MAVSTLIVVASLAMTPVAIASPTSPLAQAVDTVRNASSCPPLQSDPLVERVAGMATAETSGYSSHNSAAVPFTDPLPALKTIGYPGGAALLLSGYGATEGDAIHALMLQWRTAVPACTYTQYGVSTLRGESGAVFTAVVLATP
jgi:hypothetical protein